MRTSPKSKFDPILDLLAHSESVESQENMIHIARDFARDAALPGAEVFDPQLTKED